MRNLAIYLAALATLSPGLGLRHGSRQLRDLLAFPKYQIDFLNDLPLSASDADRCKAVGVEVEDEFTQVRFEGRKGLGEGDGGRAKLEIMPMKLPSLDGMHEHNYLCLMPSENATASQVVQEEEYEEVDPAQGWAALSHLDGKCLYTKQGWFTYSYCHNSHIRQFRQAPHQHPHPAAGFTPEEDQRYEAYTLGQATAPPSSQRGTKRKATLPGQKQTVQGDALEVDKVNAPPTPPTSIDRLNHDHAVSYGLAPSSRYLVQRWSDGTRCDKTNRPREIEVQVHCSMTTTDTIYLIKELSICNYVMIIHTPHLCGLPGFRADHSPVDSARVRCREVISDADFERWDKGEEVVMPFLTIGKEEGQQVSEPQPEAGAGAERVEEQGSLAYRQGRGEEGDGPSVDELKAALQHLSEHIKSMSGDGGEDEEVMFFTLDEGEGGEPVIIEAEIVDPRGNGNGNVGGDGDGHGAIDKEMVMRMVKEYLRKKDKPKRSPDDGDDEHDEL